MSLHYGYSRASRRRGGVLRVGARLASVHPFCQTSRSPHGNYLKRFLSSFSKTSRRKSGPVLWGHASFSAAGTSTARPRNIPGDTPFFHGHKGRTGRREREGNSLLQRIRPFRHHGGFTSHNYHCRRVSRSRTKNRPRRGTGGNCYGMIYCTNRSK